jgi:hypothetical protein
MKSDLDLWVQESLAMMDRCVGKKGAAPLSGGIRRRLQDMGYVN